MDFKTRAADVVKSYNKYRNGSEVSIHDLIIEVCNLFNTAVDAPLKPSDYHFLRFIASEIGLPQYFDLLFSRKGKQDIIYQLSDLLAAIQDSALFVDEESMLHRYQKKVYDKFSYDHRNRFFLSAPTSFGKTYLVYKIIQKMSYDNLVLIFPTIALLGENYLKLLDLKKGSSFWHQYNIHTLSEEEEIPGKNIWIYTPERFMSYIDKHKTQRFDFVFIDEIYKIDNQYIIDVETMGENERDVSFRVALFDTCMRARDILLSGPYISFPKADNNNSLLFFLKDNDFSVLNFNNIEIVNKLYLPVNDKKLYRFDNLDFNIKSKDKKKKLLTILDVILQESKEEIDKGTIVYCSRKVETESIAKFLIKNLKPIKKIKEELSIFIEHLATTFGDDWVVVNSLKYGIGIHHGLVPKYIQREIIKLFNAGTISILISTTTITEGINTTAKNMIVMSNRKGDKMLKRFDAQNIAGRAGRFNSHFSGRVITVDNDFLQTIFEEGECLKHKGYDIKSKKTDVDLDISPNYYLSNEEKLRKAEIEEIVRNSELPEIIISSFKTISKIDKVKLYARIRQINCADRLLIESFCKQIAYGRFNWEGFDLICKILVDLVKEPELNLLMTQQTKSGHVLLTPKVYYYLQDGFMGAINNEKEYYKRTTDAAIRESAKMIYNMFRYQLSKYLGIFDLLYRYELSKLRGKDIDEIPGISYLIQRLEYGSTIEKAKKANDYGVPYSIVKYYETNDPKVIQGFDKYESIVFDRVKDVL